MEDDVMLAILRAAHLDWSFDRNNQGQIECRQGKYTYLASGIADAGRGVALRERELREGNTVTVITGHTW